VGDQVQAELAAALEHAAELLGRMAHFGRVEADADDLVAERQGFFQRGERLFLAQVAQEAHDQGGADRRVPAGAPDAVDHGLERHAARGMGLRVEENFGVAHVVGRGAPQVGRRHVVEILLREQHAGAGVVNVEKRLKIIECISFAQAFNRFVGQPDPISLSQLKDQFRFE
jgi:hypothetical protein